MMICVNWCLLVCYDSNLLPQIHCQSMMFCSLSVAQQFQTVINELLLQLRIMQNYPIIGVVG